MLQYYCRTVFVFTSERMDGMRAKTGEQGYGISDRNMKRAALFIGINDYQPPLRSLSCASEDAAALYQLFLRDYTPGLVHLLNNSDSDGIIDKLKYLMDQLDKDDLLLVYFSGHGVEEKNNHYLLSSKAERWGDEWRHAISINVLKQITKKRGVQTVFILDSCREHIYEGSRSAAGMAQTRGVTIKKLVETKEADYPAPVVFCSCTGGEMAFEVKEVQHGLFTMALIDLLSNAKSATLDDITRNVAIALQNLVKKYRLKGSQTPEVIKCPLVNPVIWGTADAVEPQEKTVERVTTRRQTSAEKPVYNAKNYKIKFQTVRDILALKFYSQEDQQKKINLLQEIHQLHDNGDCVQAYTLLETLYDTVMEDKEIYDTRMLKKQIDDQLPRLKEFLPPLFEIDYTIACGDFERGKYKQAQDKMKILLNRDIPPAEARKAVVDKQIMQQKRREEAEIRAEKRRRERREAMADFLRKFKKFCIRTAYVLGVCLFVALIAYMNYKQAQKEKEKEEERQYEASLRKPQSNSQVQKAPDEQSERNRSRPSTTQKHLVLSGNVIQPGAFMGNTDIESVTFDDTVMHIGPQAFKNCTNLKRVIFGRYVVNVYSRAFEGCSKLNYVECRNGMTAIAPDAFLGCSNLQSIQRNTVPMPAINMNVNTMDLYGQDAFF